MDSKSTIIAHKIEINRDFLENFTIIINGRRIYSRQLTCCCGVLEIGSFRDPLSKEELQFLINTVRQETEKSTSHSYNCFIFTDKEDGLVGRHFNSIEIEGATKTIIPFRTAHKNKDYTVTAMMITYE